MLRAVATATRETLAKPAVATALRDGGCTAAATAQHLLPIRSVMIQFGGTTIQLVSLRAAMLGWLQHSRVADRGCAESAVQPPAGPAHHRGLPGAAAPG